jgi:phthiocerol/phenolphthiocerol synthesis type-I polyketide synthase E
VPGYPYQRRRFWVDAPPGYQPLRDVPVALAGRRTDNPDTATEALPTGAAGPPDPPAPDDWSIGIPDWVRRHDGRPRGPDRPTGAATAVLALPARADLAATVRTAFQRAGYGTVLATVRRDGDPERPIGTLLDASSDADWDALLHRAERSGRPSVVAYAALLDAPDTVELSTVDAQLARGYYGVLACARAIARAQRRGSGAVTLIVLTRHSVDVTGGEPVNPATAMVHGLVRTIELEHPTIRCVVLDVGAETATEPLTAAVADPTDPLLALRGTATWAPVLRQVPRPGHGGPPSLRTGGVYLITGGLGGIGLVVAKALADSGLGPRIALLGRSAVPDPGAPRRARGKGRAARVSGGEVAAALAELTDAGAEVLVVTADVADPTAMRAALRTIEERFGPVNGVVHAAGVPGGGLLDRRNREDTEAVFAAKIDGTLVLDECFAGRPPLDFLLLCSSQASLTGLVGSADYAAANGFLNAYAQQRGRGAGATTAVAWPGWSEVGMMAAAGADLDAVIGTAPAPVALDQAGTDAHPAEPESVEYLVRYDQRQDWELDEHRFDGVPLLAGTSALALTLTAVRTLGLFPPDTPLDLRDAVFLSPINGAEPIEVGVVLTPMGDTFRFRVQSRPAGSDGSWKYHVNGVVAGSAEPARRVNPDAPRTAMTALPDTDAGTLTGRLQYGPRWHTLTGLWHGAGEFVAELTLPEPFHADLASHPVHPALVDRASIAILIAGYRPTGQYLPFLYRRFTSFGPLPSKVLVFGRPGRERPGVLVIDADICDPKTGAVLLELRSYTVRETQPDQFTHRLAATAEPARREPAAPGVAAANGSRPVDDSPTAGGLPLLNPRDGAAAFREVLDGGYPPLVLVQAPGPRVEVRGMPWTDRATPPPSQPSPPVVEAPVLAGAAESAGSGVDMVDTLRELWSEALGVDEIALDDDFFDLGGNSLVSVQLSARIRQRFGVDLSAAALFDATTIRLLADELTALGAR